MKLINDKLILVIGGTGAQGQAVVKALIEPSSDGAPSPYTVRILTRNPDHPKVKAEFNHPNVELKPGAAKKRSRARASGQSRRSFCTSLVNFRFLRGLVAANSKPSSPSLCKRAGFRASMRLGPFHT